MKNRILSFFVMMTLFAILFIFASCGDGNNPAENPSNTEVTLVSSAFYSSEFVSLPNKTEYLLNETFDATGLELKLVYEDTYSDQTTKLRTLNITYPDENLEFTVPDFSTLGEKWISVTYNDGEFFPSISFTVWVKENISSSDPVDPDPENPTVMYTTLDSISIKNLPIKTIYSLNESFDPTGLEITATYTETYSDWTTQSKNVDITYPNNMISLSEVDMTTEGTKTITLTFTEDGSSLTCTFQVTVINPSVFTYSDNAVVNSNSYKEGDNITISIPATENGGNTTVNIAKLYEQYTTIAEKVGENGSVAISYGNAANTTIENGLDMDLEQYPEDASKFKAFFEAIAPENATAESLPSISATFGVAGNLYGTGIDKFFEKYYTLGASDKLNGTDVIGSTGYFDALEYLESKGGVAYDNQNNYVEDSLYNLNINVALWIGGNLKNVNIKGDISGEIAIFQGTFTNVRFAENTSGFTFSDSAHGVGLIEFAGDAPSITPRVDSGRLVLRNISSDNVIFQNGFSVDVSALSATDIANSSISDSGAAFAEVIYGTTEAKNAGGFISSSKRVGNDLVSGPDYYTTNQQWVKAANENKWIKLEGGVKYPDVSNLSAKANLDEKNNNKLLNTILFNNQKVYG